MVTARQIIERRRQLWEQHKSVDQDFDFIHAVADHLRISKELRDEVFNEPELLIEMCFVVVDKDQKIVPFFLNEVQHMFKDKLRQAIKDYEAKKRLHLKFLVLKGRQQG